jgi:superfamily II DNA/RNA helicase
VSGHDIIGQAKTGTGKTLGFGIPLLQRIQPQGEAADRKGRPQALVIVPTRELCVQVAQDLTKVGSARGLRVLPVYGGRAYEPQAKLLRRGADVVVGTPGRLLAMIRDQYLDLSQVGVLVLDEADEMLDMGFLPDVETLISHTPRERQTMLFSATMPSAVVTLARRYMTLPTHIQAADPVDSGPSVAAIDQHVFRAHSLDKIEVLARILQAKERGRSMIFCGTKRSAARVADQLQRRNFRAAAVHGDLAQQARERALHDFRDGAIDVLVATDVAARGISVEGVTHVVNYKCPPDEKTYLHRIGRTGRAGASGIAITLVDWDDLTVWGLINKALDLPHHDPRETYSTSDHLYEELGIPPEASGEVAMTEAAASARQRRARRVTRKQSVAEEAPSRPVRRRTVRRRNPRAA